MKSLRPASMAPKKLERSTTGFGPEETDAIATQKWHKKLHDHLSTWPGVGLPWSEAAAPEWCSRGYDLVTTFYRTAGAVELESKRGTTYFADDDVPLAKHIVYPWVATMKTPFGAATVIEVMVDGQVQAWIHKPNQRLDESHRAAVNNVIDKTTLGEISGIWNARKPEQVQAWQDIDPRDLVRHLGPVIMPEVARRVGSNAAERDADKAIADILKEMLLSGELRGVYDQIARAADVE